MNEELMIQIPANAVEVFKPETMNALIERVKGIVKDAPKDTTTTKGRKEIASLAYKIAQTKSAIDEAGKNLVEPMKAQAKLIDAERKHARDELDALKAEVRKPLDEWEAAEAARVQLITDAIARINAIGTTVFEKSAQVDAAIAQLKTEAAFDFKDKKDIAAQQVELCELRLAKRRAELIDAETKAAEAEKARIESERKATEARLAREAQERKEREERIARESAERATREAEARAKAEAERVKLESERAERERAAAIERESQRRICEEKAKADAERRHAEELVAAAERAKVQAENAARVEREKIEAEKKAESEALAKREADKAHTSKILTEAKEAIAAVLANVETGEEPAKSVVRAIRAGKIPHVTINF